MLSQKRRLAPPLIACALVLAAIALLIAHHYHHTKPVATGEPLPPMSLTDLRGEPVILQPQHRGITIYNVFTTWCPGCREETPMFAKEAQRLKERGIDVVGIDQGEPSGPIESFEAQFNVTYPIVIDTQHVSNAILGARVIPQTVVVKDGIVKAIAVGPLTPQALQAMIGRV